jgi:uncharacterized protein
VLLPRRAGQKEARYAHLLAGQPVEEQGLKAEPPRAADSWDDEDTAESPARPTLEDLQRQIDELRAAFEEFRKLSS